MELCRFLRFKALYGAELPTADAVAALLAASDAPFTCLHTQAGAGPDDALVAPDHCQAHRGCFERSPRSPIA